MPLQSTSSRCPSLTLTTRCISDTLLLLKIHEDFKCPSIGLSIFCEGSQLFAYVAGPSCKAAAHMCIDLQDESPAATLLSAADGASVAAIRGLTVLADAALPPSVSLLPAELKRSLPDRFTFSPLTTELGGVGVHLIRGSYRALNSLSCQVCLPHDTFRQKYYEAVPMLDHLIMIQECTMPCRLLKAASDMSGKLSPRQQAVMEGALNLALRLGLATEKLLQQLLHADGGAQLYQAYRRAVCILLTQPHTWRKMEPAWPSTCTCSRDLGSPQICTYRDLLLVQFAIVIVLHNGLECCEEFVQGAQQQTGLHRYGCLQVTSWVLWNAGAVCKPLCQVMGGASQAADVAQRMLLGTLEALQRGGIAGHADPRAR